MIPDPWRSSGRGYEIWSQPTTFKNVLVREGTSSTQEDCKSTMVFLIPLAQSDSPIPWDGGNLLEIEPRKIRYEQPTCQYALVQDLRTGPFSTRRRFWRLRLLARKFHVLRFRFGAVKCATSKAAALGASVCTVKSLSKTLPATSVPQMNLPLTIRPL